MKTKYLITLFLTLFITSTAFSQKYKVAKIKKYSMFRFLLFCMFLLDPGIIFAQADEKSKLSQHSMDEFYNRVFHPEVVSGLHYIAFKIKAPQYSGKVIAVSRDWFIANSFRNGEPSSKKDSVFLDSFKKTVKNDEPFNLDGPTFDSLARRTFITLPKESSVYQQANLGVDSFLTYYFIWDEHSKTYYERTLTKLGWHEKYILIYDLFRWGYFVAKDDESGFIITYKWDNW